MPAHKLSDVKALAPGLVIIGGSVAIGASGVVSSQDASGLTGGVVTQTASEDGRYTITFNQTWKRILSYWVTMGGPADNAFPTTTGSDPATRNAAVTGLQAQFKRTDTQADTDPASGTVLCWGAIVATV
jgi:hypothetical protein